MNREGKVIVSLLVVMMCGGIYGYYQLHERIQSTERLASTCRCPTSNAGHHALAQIGRVSQNMTWSHSYFERLLEGLARRNGLPLEAARQQFSKQFPAAVSRGWKWLAPWEGGAVKEPVPSPAPLRTMGPPPPTRK